MISLTEFVPPEIIQVIIDNVASDESEEDRLKALKACSLTCQTFLPFCRRQIFQSIELKDHGYYWGPPSTPYRQSMADRFAQLITDTPAIANFVQDLHYSIRPNDFDNPFSQVASALKHIMRLKTLTLSPSYGYASDWPVMAPSMRSCLLHLLHLPTIVSLNLIAMKNFNPFDLILCNNLRHLTLNRFTMIEHDGNILANLPANRIQLNKLCLHHTSDIITGLCLSRQKRPDIRPLLDLGELKDISITISVPHDIPLVLEIFKKIRHLESVLFFIPEECHAADLTSTISACSETLRFLDIDFYIDSNHVDPLSGLCQIFEEIAGKNRIEILTIGINIQTDESCSTGDEWGLLEKVLLAPGWSFLVQLDLSITINSYSRTDDKVLENGLRRLPETQFQRLVSRKSLAFNFSVTEYLV